MSYSKPPLKAGHSMTEVDVADYVKLPGVFTFATLPMFTSVGVGTTAYTSDMGTCTATATGWAVGTGDPNAAPILAPGVSGSITLSNSTIDLYPSPSPADRIPVIGPAAAALQSWEGPGCGEPNVWFNPVDGFYHMIYTAGGSTTGSLGYAYATVPNGTWTKPLTVPVIGNGHGGVAASSYVQHTGMYIDTPGATIYIVTSLYPYTGALQLYSAPLNFSHSTGPVFTLTGTLMASLPSGFNGWGNSALVPTGANTWALLFDIKQTSTSNYLTGLATATGALSSAPTFTVSGSSPLTQLSTGITYWGTVAPATLYGSQWTVVEGTTCVLYYLAGPRATTPSDIFVATSPVSDLVNWTVLNNGYPVYRREHLLEVDQAADPSLVIGPGGDAWIYVTANDNLNGTYNIMAAPMYLASKVTSNGNSEYLQKTNDNFNQLAFNAPTYLQTPQTTYTARNKDDIRYNNGINSLVVTAPRANWDTFFRVTNFNPVAGKTLTVTINGADKFGFTSTAGGSVLVLPGESITFIVCQAGSWAPTKSFAEYVRVISASGSVTGALTDKHISVTKGTGAATTVNLPANPWTGLSLTVDDGKGDAATNNITITPAAGNIDGSGTYVINSNYGSWSGYYDGAKWKTTASR